MFNFHEALNRSQTIGGSQKVVTIEETHGGESQKVLTYAGEVLTNKRSVTELRKRIANGEGADDPISDTQKLAKKRAEEIEWAEEIELTMMANIHKVCLFIYQESYNRIVNYSDSPVISPAMWVILGSLDERKCKRYIAITGNDNHYEILKPKYDDSFTVAEKASLSEPGSKNWIDLTTQALSKFEKIKVHKDGDCGYWSFLGAMKLLEKRENKEKKKPSVVEKGDESDKSDKSDESDKSDAQQKDQVGISLEEAQKHFEKYYDDKNTKAYVAMSKKRDAEINKTGKWLLIPNTPESHKYLTENGVLYYDMLGVDAFENGTFQMKDNDGNMKTYKSKTEAKTKDNVSYKKHFREKYNKDWPHPKKNIVNCRWIKEYNKQIDTLNIELVNKNTSSERALKIKDEINILNEKINKLEPSECAKDGDAEIEANREGNNKSLKHLQSLGRRKNLIKRSNNEKVEDIKEKNTKNAEEKTNSESNSDESGNESDTDSAVFMDDIESDWSENMF